MDIRLKRLLLGQLHELSFYSKKCATDCALIRELLGDPFSLGMRFSEPLSMTTDFEPFRAILDRMSIFKLLKNKGIISNFEKECRKSVLWSSKVNDILALNQ